MTSASPEWVVAAAAVFGMGASVAVWVTKQIVRGEMEGVRQDIEVLRVAVFNHLAHGAPAGEGDIRTRLGYAGRK